MRNKKFICIGVVLTLFLTVPAATNYAVKIKTANSIQAPIDAKNHSTLKWPDKNDKYPILYVLPPQNNLKPTITNPNPEQPIDNMPLVPIP